MTFCIAVNPLAHAIASNKEDFKAQFGVAKPNKDDLLVVMCKGGVRCRTAQFALLGAGFTNVR